MHVVVLIAFVVALTVADLPSLEAGRWLLIPAVAAYLTGTVALGATRTAVSVRAIFRYPGSFVRIVRRHNVLAALAQVWLVGGLAGLVVLGWGAWARDDLGLARIPLAGEITILLPFLIALMLNWWLEYPFYRLVRARVADQQYDAGVQVRPCWTLGEYLAYNLRHEVLFVVVPVSLILLLTDSLRLLYPLLPLAVREPVLLAGSSVCAGGVFLCSPLLIVRIWRTARLPDGLLRDELREMCRQMRVRCRDLLIWRSGGMIANAGVMGLIGRIRYVLLSDGLLDHMSPREIKSIFAHEAGHIRCHHLFYSMLFAVSSVTLCWAAGDVAAGPVGPRWAWIGEVTTFGLLAAAWAVGFGWISRRFERQSDVIAAWFSALDGPDAGGRITPEGAAIFARSLERVAQLNGASPRQWNWRHGSIAGRVAHVLWLGSTAGTRSQIDRVVRRIKAGLWVATVVSAAIAAVRLTLGV